MNTATDLDRVWNLADRIGFCMLTTVSNGEIVSRPMTAHADRSAHAFFFLTDADAVVDDEVEADPRVGLAFADTSGQKYVSISGRATVRNDREKIRELWSAPMKAWWSGPEDPSIRVLEVMPIEAEYWASPGTVMSYVKMLAASVTHSRPDIGVSGRVHM